DHAVAVVVDGVAGLRRARRDRRERVVAVLAAARDRARAVSVRVRALAWVDAARRLLVALAGGARRLPGDARAGAIVRGEASLDAVAEAAVSTREIRRAAAAAVGGRGVGSPGVGGPGVGGPGVDRGVLRGRRGATRRKQEH